MSIITEIEEYAKNNNIPIMEKEGIEFLTNYIRKNQIKSILEIGSAIGYSAIKMALVDKNIKIKTIERDKIRYDEAVNNVLKLNLSEQIEIINEDALNIEIMEKYDLIFIDAAKSQYINFFNKYSKNLKENGVIVSDNLNFHGLTKTDEKKLSKNLKGLTRKLKMYIQFLENNKDFTTEFHSIGDGISVSKK